MRICLIVEGAYPYVSGGVSSWMVQLMKSMPQHEFVVQVIYAERTTKKRKFQCEIPDNLSEIEEVYLQDEDFTDGKPKSLKLSLEEYKALEQLIFGEIEDWRPIFELFQRHISLNQLLCGEYFFEIVKKYYLERYERIAFSDFLWTLRSMYLPLFTILKAPLIKADIYHAVATGYAGILGCMQKMLLGGKLIVTEHGIYTREREEEIIRADWVKGVYKDLWIEQFKKLSQCAYRYSNHITALFHQASAFQRELGCAQEKQHVIPNGVNAANFEGIPQKEKEDTDIHIGAVLRVTPIKDVKTLLSAFAVARKANEHLKLWIMGPLEEDPDYVEECYRQVRELEIPDVTFTGKIQVKEYIGKMDILVLSSLSEGQPLAVLEGFAAAKPFITTNVGNCREMLYGCDESDDFGKAGIVVPILGINQMAKAMLDLAADENRRKKMGEAGLARAKKYFDVHETFRKYQELYTK